MAKKKPVKKCRTSKVKRVRSEGKSVPITEKDRILHLIKVSKGAISKQGNTVDEFFTNQVARLTKQLEELDSK